MNLLRNFKQPTFSSLSSLLVIASMMLSLIQPQPAQAQSGDGIKREINAESGRVSFIGPESGRSVSALRALGTFIRPQNPAMALVKRFGPEFGLQDPERDLSEMKNKQDDNGRVTVRYQQNYQGIPVMGGELIVDTNEQGDLYSMNGEVSPNLSLSIQTSIDSARARQTALQSLAKWYQKQPSDFVASEPELWIYDESLLQQSTRPVELVWRMEVTSANNDMPVRELILVNAQRGGISLHFNQIDLAWTGDQPGANPSTLEASHLYEGSALFVSSALVNTYTANNTSSLPGTFLCNESQQPCTINNANPHADAAHKYAIGTYNFYASKHLRDSIDNNGMVITSTVQYCDPNFPCPYDNAYWDGTQMVYGSAHGYPLADDIVAHELTHGVTQYESDLYYFYQSGAINESLSDLWGEYYDQVGNVTAGDTAGVKWLLGEDVSGLGAVRSMSNPQDYGSPDKMSSPLYDQTPTYDYLNWDNGGVHTNSGVNNKAVYLMVDGGTFNGRTVTALGWDKTAAIYYEANSNLLSSGADYSDLYYALQQACTNLIGQIGITAGDCIEVKDAVDAVEMNLQPVPNFNTDAPVCDAGMTPHIVFADDLETGTSNWSVSNGAYIRWQLDSPLGRYAQSGVHSWYADDLPDTVTDARVQLASTPVPANAYLHFAQAYDFEYDPFANYDGGVLEYSTNSGASWNDAGSLIQYNGYTGTIASGYSNPLMGRAAFVGSSHGYISTRLNLASLAGRTVTFRWRMGLDIYGYSEGWWVDNVKLYTCLANLSGNAGLANVTLSYIDGTAKTVMSDGSGNYSITVPQGWTGTLMPYKTGYLFTPLNRSYNNLQSNLTSQNYTAQACPTCADIDASIGGLQQGKYTLGSSQGTRDSYVNVDSGPVKVISTNGVPLIASQRINLKSLPTYSSYSEFMGIPASKLTDTYIFPWYNNATAGGLQSQLRFGNVGVAETDVTVKVGGISYGPYHLALNGSQRVTLDNVDAGPVEVKSSGGVPIVASMRINLKTLPTYSSYSEFMGLPASATVGTKYMFPWYGNATAGGVQSQLRFGNVGVAETDVTVKVGGVSYGPYHLGLNGSQRVTLDNVDAGPVEVNSSGGVPIIASMRINLKTNPVFSSYAEFMGLPGATLTETRYYFSWYNNATAGGLQSQLRFGNVGNAETDVTVKVGGVSYGPYHLGLNGSQRIVLDNVDAGPVEVFSSGGVPIIASMRVNLKPNGFYSSYSEFMGLSVGAPLGMPGNQLSTTYWFPWYNNANAGGLQSQLRFGVP